MFFGLGAVSTTNVGLPVPTITGDPVSALAAQLNRFDGKTISLKQAPGGTSGCDRKQVYVRGAFPTGAGADSMLQQHASRAAFAANLIVYDSMTCLSDPRLLDVQGAKIVDAVAPEVMGAWMMTNLHDITVRIAQFGDQIGLKPAPIGITTLDPKIKNEHRVEQVSPMILGLVSVGAVGLGIFFARRAP